RPNREPVATNVFVRIEANTKLPPARIDALELKRHFFRSLSPMINSKLEHPSKITNEAYLKPRCFKETDQLIEIKRILSPTFFSGRLVFTFRRQRFSPTTMFGKNWKK